MIRLLEKITSKESFLANAVGQVANVDLDDGIGSPDPGYGKHGQAQNAQAIADAMTRGPVFGQPALHQGHQLWDALGQDTEKCQKGGFLALFLAIIFAIIIVLVLIFCQPCLLLLFQAAAAMGSASAATAAMLATTVGGGMLVASTTTLVIAGAVAGAIGGAIGGAIAGTGALQGAITGAAVGAAIGMCGAGFAGAPAGGTTTTSGTAAKVGTQGTVKYGTTAFGSVPTQTTEHLSQILP